MAEEFVSANIIPFSGVRREARRLPLSARESVVAQMRAIEVAWVRTIRSLGPSGTLDQAEVCVRQAAALIIGHLEAMPMEAEDDGA